MLEKIDNKPSPAKKRYQIETLMISPFANITYLVLDVFTKTCALIDSPWDIQSVLQKVETMGYKLTSVMMTHTHLDHIKDTSHLFKEMSLRGVKLDLYISKKEAKFWGKECDELVANKVYFLEDGKPFKFGKTKITPLLTPGHTPGSICYLLKNDVIVGDVLFTFGCGRVDLWGCGKCKEKNQFIDVPNCGRCDKKSGDVKALYQSLQYLKQAIPDFVNVRCGHFYGDVEYVSMLEQKQKNPYLLASDFEEFYELRVQS